MIRKNGQEESGGQELSCHARNEPHVVSELPSTLSSFFFIIFLKVEEKFLPHKTSSSSLPITLKNYLHDFIFS